MFSSIKKITNLFDYDEKKSFLRVLVLVFIMAILDSIGIVSIMPFLSVASNTNLIDDNYYLNYIYANLLNNYLQNHDQFLIFLGSVSFISIIFSSLYRIYTQFTLNKFIEKRRHSIAIKLLNIYLGKDYEDLLNENTSDITKNILSEVDQVVQQVIRPFIMMITYGIVVLIMILVLLLINPFVSIIVAFVFGGLYIVFYTIAKNKLKIIGNERLNANEFRFKVISEAFGGLKNVKLDKTEAYYIEEYKPHSKRYADCQSIAVTINQVPQYLVEALAIGGVIVVTVYMILNLGGVNTNAFSQIIPFIGLYVFAAYRLQPSLRSVYQGLASIRFGSSSLKVLLREITKTNEIDTYKSNKYEIKRSNKINIKDFSNIELKHVYYKYTNSTTSTLIDVNLMIKRYDFIGIIGESGSGKTTLIDVVLGLLSPQKGFINLDGNSINSNSIYSYQSLFSYVPQEPCLINKSIYNNIILGSSVANRQKVNEAIELSCLKEFTDSLENGIDSIIKEKGKNLSGGQKQRLSIARALYKDPEIIILDECTSALDEVTEKELMLSLNKLKGKKTVILITHNIQNLKDFDKIYSIKNGSVIDVK